MLTRVISDDLLLYIATFLDAPDLCSLESSSKQTYYLITEHDSVIWRELCLKKWQLQDLLSAKGLGIAEGNQRWKGMFALPHIPLATVDAQQLPRDVTSTTGDNGCCYVKYNGQRLGSDRAIRTSKPFPAAASTKMPRYLQLILGLGKVYSKSANDALVVVNCGHPSFRQNSRSKPLGDVTSPFGSSSYYVEAAVNVPYGDDRFLYIIVAIYSVLSGVFPAIWLATINTFAFIRLSSHFQASRAKMELGKRGLLIRDTNNALYAANPRDLSVPAPLRSQSLVAQVTNIAYYEATLLPPFSRGCVSIGFATKQFRLEGRQVGWDRHSWGYHGDDGKFYHGSGYGGTSFGSQFNAGDTVGCGIIYPRHASGSDSDNSNGTDYNSSRLFSLSTPTLFYTLNGKWLGAVTHVLPLGEELYPAVGIDTKSTVQMNLGTAPFLFKKIGDFDHKSSRIISVGGSIFFNPHYEDDDEEAL